VERRHRQGRDSAPRPHPLVSAILGVSGSPRREGNTDLLVLEALRALAERTDARTEFLRVAELRIEPCRGCRACMKLGHCAIQDDDFEALMARLRAADLFVLGAPGVYGAGAAIVGGKLLLQVLGRVEGAKARIGLGK